MDRRDVVPEDFGRRSLKGSGRLLRRSRDLETSEVLEASLGRFWTDDPIRSWFEAAPGVCGGLGGGTSEVFGMIRGPWTRLLEPFGSCVSVVAATDGEGSGLMRETAAVSH